MTERINKNQKNYDFKDFKIYGEMRGYDKHKK